MIAFGLDVVEVPRPRPPVEDVMSTAARRANTLWMVRRLAPLRRARMLALAAEQGEGQAELAAAAVEDRRPCGGWDSCPNPAHKKPTLVLPAVVAD